MKGINLKEREKCYGGIDLIIIEKRRRIEDRRMDIRRKEIGLKKLRRREEVGRIKNWSIKLGKDEI